MEAKPEKLKQVLSLILSHLKVLETEVLALRAVFATVKRLGVVSDLDERLHAATLAAERKRLGNTPFRREACVVKSLDE